MVELFSRPETWAAIATLTLLEVVLGIDNLVFIALIAGRLPEDRQPLARKIGLFIAFLARLVLLLGLAWIISLTKPLISVYGLHFSGKELILLGGGLFLIAKSTHEIYEKTELVYEETKTETIAKSFGMIIFQIVLIDLVFSLDSLITAIGIVKEIPIIAVAIFISITVMFVSAEAVSKFINKHPSLKMLALAFLLLIGVLLVAEGTGQEFNRGYIYFAMGFSLLVETLNIRRRNNLIKKGLLKKRTAN